MRRGHIALVAAEASGDLLGGRLMAALKKQGFEGKFFGVGGKEMIDEGLESVMPLSLISQVAVIGVILHGFALLWRIRKIANSIIAGKPDALIIIDSYDLTHRIARSVFRRAPDIKIINYVPPKAWVWRKGRAKKMKKYITHCLVLFPFEEDFFRSYGIPTSYVGHPALEHQADEAESKAFRTRFDENKKFVLIGLGSRRKELKYLAAPVAEAMEVIKAKEPNVEFFLPLAETIAEETIEKVKTWRVQPILVREQMEKQALFRAADVALVASGTITLELGLSGTASVCIYRLNYLEEKIGFLIVSFKFASLVNLILDKMVFPEFLRRETVKPRPIAEATIKLLREDNTRTLAEFYQKLQTQEAPSVMAARKVLTISA